MAYAQALTAGRDNLLSESLVRGGNVAPFAQLAQKYAHGISPVLAADEFVADSAAVSVSDLIDSGLVELEAEAPAAVAGNAPHAHLHKIMPPNSASMWRISPKSAQFFG